MHHIHQKRRGFTVQELMIVIAIMGILVAFSFGAFNAAVAHSRTSRTKVIIAKIDQVISERYESYRTRPVPIRTPASTDPRTAAGARLNAIREVMRMELPEKITDLCNQAEADDFWADSPPKLDNMSSSSSNPPFDVSRRLITTPSLAKAYKRKAAALMDPPSGRRPWTAAYQGAECLYLILACTRDGDKSALDFFAPGEIGNFDDDAIPEILDGWGRPIEFLRWAPDFTVENNAITMQTSNSTASPDPFDPLKADSLWTSGSGAYALRPLIFSAGPDGRYDVNASASDYRGNPTPFSNPYGGSAPRAGALLDTDSSGTLDYHDNITNHYQEAE